MTANEYMNRIREAAGTKLIEPCGLYSEKEGHIRFSHEVGYAMNDFDKKQQDEIIHSSYSCIYVRACFLKPILDSGQWISLLKSQIKGNGQ